MAKPVTYKVSQQGTQRVEQQFGKLDDRFKRMRVSTAGLQRGLGVIRNQILLVTFAFGGMIAVMSKMVRAAGVQELAVKKLETVLRSTKGVAGLTSKELQEMAAQFQKVTTFGDESIITMQSLMLTFTKIGREVFPQATEAVLNISTAMGQDLQQTVIQVGKALNDPILGITALRRVGIQFSPVQEKMIRDFVELGEVASAQKIILGELETQFGGLARAASQTMVGALKQAGNAAGDAGEAFGDILAPSIIGVANWVKVVSERLGTFFRAAKTVHDFNASVAGSIHNFALEMFGLAEETKDAVEELNKLQTLEAFGAQIRALQAAEASRKALVEQARIERELNIENLGIFAAIGDMLGMAAVSLETINDEQHALGFQRAMEAIEKAAREAGINLEDLNVATEDGVSKLDLLVQKYLEKAELTKLDLKAQAKFIELYPEQARLLGLIVDKQGKATQESRDFARFASQASISLATSAISGDSMVEALKRMVLQMILLVIEAKLYAHFMTVATGGTNIIGAKIVSLFSKAPSVPDVPGVTPRITGGIPDIAPRNAASASAGMTIIIQNPIMTDDFAVQQIAPAIRRAIDLGETSGLN